MLPLLLVDACAGRILRLGLDCGDKGALLFGFFLAIKTFGAAAVVFDREGKDVS